MKEIHLFIWCFDGFDLAYTDGERSKLTGLTFEKQRDAEYALEVFNRFIYGN